MRAKEFVVNVTVPVTIKINGDGEPEISTDQPENETDTMVPPLQQKLELLKHAAGKNSSVLDQLTASEPVTR